MPDAFRIHSHALWPYFQILDHVIVPDAAVEIDQGSGGAWLDDGLADSRRQRFE